MPARAQAEKVRIAWEAKAQWQAEPLAGPVSLILTYSSVPPKSWTKKKRSDALRGLVLPDHDMRDIDNLVKLTMDGLTGVIYGDDRQVVRLTAVWSYAPVARTLIIASLV